MKLAASKMSVGINERNISRRRHRCKCEDNIIVDFKGLVCKDVHWIELTQDSVQWWNLVNTIMNLQKRRISLSAEHV
jgi:hypothetical protein